jgi:hypothetical protein
MDSIEKEERGRSSNRSIKLDKKHRGSRKSNRTSPMRGQQVGNTTHCGRYYYLAPLTNRIHRKWAITNETLQVNKEYCK